MLLVALLVGLNVAFYLAMLIRGGTSEIGRLSPGTLVRFGALHAPLVRRGERWRVFTAMFLHVSPQHLLTNMVTLVCAGILAIPRYGRARVAAIYVIAGLFGSILSVAWRWHGTEEAPGREEPLAQGFSMSRVLRQWRRGSVSAGASAAICGLIAASAVRAGMSGERNGREFLWGAALWAFFMLLDGAVGASDNAAHAGGLAAGAVMGALLPGHTQHWIYTSEFGAECGVIVMLVAIGAWMAARADDPDYRASELLTEGDELFAAGAKHDALARYERALWLAPKCGSAHLRVARVRWGERDFGGTLESALAASECDPGCDEAHDLIRRIAAELNRPR